MTEFSYIFYTNETEGSRFSDFHVGDVMAKAYEGTVLAQTPKQAVDNLFERFNIDHPADYRGRSMSVGDVVMVTDGTTMMHYACKPIGWKSVTENEFVVR